jgi:hypothetical protein
MIIWEAIIDTIDQVYMPRIDEQEAAMARAIVRESEELKNILEKELRRLEDDETIAVNEFQKDVVRALIDLLAAVAAPAYPRNRHTPPSAPHRHSRQSRRPIRQRSKVEETGGSGPAFMLYADHPLCHRWVSNRVHGLGGANGSL